MTIGQRIKQRREELQLSQDELAKKIGYKSRSSINKIELDICKLTQSKIKSIADALETTPSYIMGWRDEDELSGIDATKGAVKIPVLGRVAAGLPLLAEENIIDWEEIPEEMARTGDFFCLKIQGDSMTPRICDGDVIVVRKQPDAESGDYVVAMVNGNDAVCKKLTKFDGGITLVSMNPAYDPMVFSQKEIKVLPVAIVGKVVELRGKL